MLCEGSNCDNGLTSTGIKKEDRIRKWSVATDWPDNKLPAAGQNVTIPVEWTMYLDTET